LRAHVTGAQQDQLLQRFGEEGVLSLYELAELSGGLDDFSEFAGAAQVQPGHDGERQNDDGIHCASIESG
jgi:hypothetical protein